MNSPGGTGAEVIYALRNPSTLATSVLNNITSTGQTPRRIYQRRLPSDNSKDYYFIHRNTGQTEPLIVEYGFIDDNKNNFDFLNNNYKELAEAVIKAILTYKGLSYIPPQNSQESAYTVKSGDTLYSIAKKYNTTPANLKKQNNLTSNNLQIGQILKIKPTELTDTYTVKRGDTLYSIARKYNTTVDNLKTLNNLNNNNLTIGQSLLIPSGKVIEDNITTPTIYIVTPKDTIYSIARKYNIKPDELIAYNNLPTTILTVGQKISIPTTTNKTTYIVQRGDTLYSIANKFNTTVAKIKNLNNLSTNTLSIGQTLQIS